MRKFLLTLAMIAAFLICSQRPAEAITAYNITALEYGSEPYLHQYPVALNNNGNSCGYFTYYENSTSYEKATFWAQDGTETEIGWLENGPTSEATDINDSDVVVGCSRRQSNDSLTYSFMWSSGTITDMIAGSDAVYGFLNGINNNGIMTGYYYYFGGVRHPVKVTSSTITLMDQYGMGQYNVPNKLNDLLEFVGQASSTQSHFLNVGNTDYQIGTLGGAQTYPKNINVLGQVVGYSHITGSTAIHAFIWTPQKVEASSGTIKDYGVLTGQTNSMFLGINSWGVAVGNSGNKAIISSPCSGITDLNTLIDPLDGITLNDAVDINDKGQVLCQGRYGGTGYYRAFLLTPIP